MAETRSDSEIVVELAELFIDRYRRGERPPLEEYTSKFPQLKDRIEDVFPAMAMIENIAIRDPSDNSEARDDAERKEPHPQTIGDFRIIREVGRGGMGIVYEAEQVSLGRHVALKLLPSSALPDNKHIRRFEREAKSAAKLHHTNIVPVFGVGEQDGLHYYVMQFIQGLPLDEVIDELKKIQAQPTGTITSSTPVEKTSPFQRQQSVADVAHSLMTGQFAETQIADSDSDLESSRAVPAESRSHSKLSDSSSTNLSETLNLSGSLSGSTLKLGKSGVHSAPQKQLTYWQSVANIGAQVADALQYAHEQSILHRDIKPSNLLLDLRGTTWVTDFGLAKATDQQDITHTGDILGTLRYMPPEAFDGTADARSDVYSLGLTLYELLAFQPAFGVKERHQLIKQVTTESAPRLDKLNPQIPRDLVTIVHKAVDRDPGHRYQTAGELQQDLQRFLEDEPIKARRISLTERLARWSRRNKGLAASLATVCVLLLTISIGGTLMTLRLHNEVINGNNLNQQLIDSESQLIDQRDQAKQQKELARQNEYMAKLFAAWAALKEDGGYARAKEILRELQLQNGEENRRGIELSLLNSMPDPSPGRILHRFAGPVSNVAYSRDGRIAVADPSGAILILDADSGALVQRIVWKARGMYRMAWSPDGSRLATADYGSTVRVWDLQSGVDIFEFPGGRCVAWSPDGMQLVTGTRDGQLQIWDARTGQLRKTFREHRSYVFDVDWSRNDRLASCGMDGKVLVWDYASGESRVLTYDRGEGDLHEFRSLSFSPNGDRLVTCSFSSREDSTVVWDVESGEKLQSLPVTGGVYDVCWNHDGTRLATTSIYHQRVEIWDPSTQEQLRVFTGHSSYVRSCSWNPDGRQVASCGADGTVRVWDVFPKKPRPDFDGHSDTVRDLVWSPFGQYFATASDDNTIRIWDVRSRKELDVFARHQTPVLAVDWNPKNNRLVSCDQNGNILIWTWNGENDIQEIKEIPSDGTKNRVVDVVWSPDGTKIAAAQSGSVRIYDADTLNELQLSPLLGDLSARVGVASVSWEQESDGKSLLAGAGNVVKVWNVETRKEILSYPAADSTSDVSFFTRVALSPQGDRVAFSGSSIRNAFDEPGVSRPVLSIVDLKTKRELLLQGHSGTVLSIDWTDSGTRLLTSGMDGTAILWDSSTGRQLITIDNPDRLGLYAARFSPFDLQVALAGMTPGVQLLDATSSYAEELSKQLLPWLDRRIQQEPMTDRFDDLLLRGRIQARQGNWVKAASDFQLVHQLRQGDESSPAWFETSWWVAGPYSEPLADRQPPERQLDPFLAIPPADGLEEPGHWTAAPISTTLNLGDYLARTEHVSAYALTRVYAAERETAGLLLRADDQVRVWLNGRLKYSREQDREAVRDDEVVEITLEEGWNDLLFKVTNKTREHGLFARLSRDPRELAEAFERIEDWEQALAWWNRARTSDPDDIAVLLSHGRAALKTGRQQQADKSFNIASELLDNNALLVLKIAGIYSDYAHLLSSTDRSIEAETNLKRALALFEQLLQSDLTEVQRALTYRSRGALYVKNGQWNKAADDYSASATLDPAADSMDWMAVVALYAYADDPEGFRAQCRNMSVRFLNSSAPPDAERTVKSMLLMEHGYEFENDSEAASVRSFVDSLQDKEKIDPPSFWNYFTATRALLAYRYAEYGGSSEAQTWIDESKGGKEFRTGDVGMLQLSEQALIYAKQGSASEARSVLKELTSRMANYGVKWRDGDRLDGETIMRGNKIYHDMLIPEIFRREAERLIQDRANKPKSEE